MRVLVTFAVEAEFAPWRRLRNLKPIEVQGQMVYRVQVGRADVDIVMTGIGVENAERVASLILNSEYQFCISSGFAGALRREYSLGDILVGRAVQRIGKSETLESSRNLFQEASKRGAKQANLFLTSDELIQTATDKAKLAPFGEAAEMETFGVFSAAHGKSVPAVAIRAISDTADKDLPIAIDKLVDEHGRAKAGAVARYILRHPNRVPSLIRLGRESWSVAAILADFLEVFIKQISFYSHGWYPEGEGLEKVAAR